MLSTRGPAFIIDIREPTTVKGSQKMHSQKSEMTAALELQVLGPLPIRTVMEDLGPKFESASQE